MVYYTQNHQVRVVCRPEFQITRKQRFENWIYFRLQVGGWRHILCCVS
jgi:hypothetical protein